MSVFLSLNRFECTNMMMTTNGQHLAAWVDVERRRCRRSNLRHRLRRCTRFSIAVTQFVNVNFVNLQHDDFDRVRPLIRVAIQPAYDRQQLERVTSSLTQTETIQCSQPFRIYFMTIYVSYTPRMGSFIPVEFEKPKYVRGCE